MTRQCGDCQLCCKLLPVQELGKLANQKCRHQKFGVGCAIYTRCPRSCRLWSCQWLIGGEHTETLRRPDRGRYVIDIIPEFITVRPHDGSSETRVPVVQVWLDPRFPNAWRDAGLLAYLDQRSQQGFAALIRTSSHQASVLWPPRLTGEQEWKLMPSAMCEAQHSADEIVDTLAKRGLGFDVKLELTAQDIAEAMLRRMARSAT
jgi:hypothetical protein